MFVLVCGCVCVCQPGENALEVEEEEEGWASLGWDIKRNQWLPWEITARVCILNIPVKYQ